MFDTQHLIQHLKGDEDMLNCKRIETSIRRAKKKLIAKAKKDGIYENFGQLECRKISEKFIDIDDYTDEMNNRRKLLNNFSSWCSTFGLNEMNRGEI